MDSEITGSGIYMLVKVNVLNVYEVRVSGPHQGRRRLSHFDLKNEWLDVSRCSPAARRAGSI